MSKRLIEIDGQLFIRMAEAGARRLNAHAEEVNRLNVFPVPDGDTGTNMNLSLTSGVEELRKRPSAHLGRAAEALAKGLLMGARGNSGVILSQLFRGFAKSVAELETANAAQLAAAFQHGVDLAYKAVVKPVEGTILTVAREAAKAGTQAAKRHSDVADVMREVLLKGKEALARTPELLPVLKQVGVVDSGGQGLIYVYEGFMNALGEVDILEENETPTEPADMPYAAFGALQDWDEATELEAAEGAHSAPNRAQAMLATESIEYGYCTEFMLKLTDGKSASGSFDEGRFREELSAWGDSLLVVADDELVKVHIHAEFPGSVMNAAQRYGDLSRIKIENMRDQHSHLLHGEPSSSHASAATDDGASAAAVAGEAPDAERQTAKPYGFVAVAAGDGIRGIFASLGVDRIVQGGQTMNPSTEDIVRSVSEVDASTVFVLPNNSNIILAAQQATELVPDKRVVVIPSKSIPQGIAAVIAFEEEATAETNAREMERALKQVESGQVTRAVRDTQMDGIDIAEGDYIAICGGRIVAVEAECAASCRLLIDQLLAEGAEVLTIYTGADANPGDTGELVAYMETSYPDVELEVHPGGQPLYNYMFSAE